MQYNEDRTAIEVANAEAVLDNGDVQVNLSSEEEDYSYAASVEKVDLSPISADEFFSATLIGNANANALYAGSGGSSLDGGYNAIKSKATNDQLIGGSGDDVFVYNFDGGLGGKDVITNYGAGDDVISLDVAPKSVTTNGKNVVLNFEERVNGKKKTGTLTINGAGKITSDTTIAIEIAGDYGEYRFANKLKKAAWSSEDYWFAQSDSASDELTQLSAVEDALVMPLDFDAFRQSTNALELPSCSARKRLKT